MQPSLINFIMHKISEVSHIPLEDISENEPLRDLGLSSYMLAEICAAVEEEFETKIPLLQIANGASIAELADASMTEGLVAITA